MYLQTRNEQEPVHAGLLEAVDLLRVSAVQRLDPGQRGQMGQFLTPLAVARFMAALFSESREPVQLLDAGAGVGTLTAAFVEEMCRRMTRPQQVEATLYEIEPLLGEYLHTTLDACQELCCQHGIEFIGDLRTADFIVDAVSQLRGDLFAPPARHYNRAILNPPYRKIQSESQYRILMREIDVETSNLYTAFLAIVVRLLEPEGELVAITPRSFCNGPYFKSFRQLLLSHMSLRYLHVFEARDKAFSEDDVLQENVIIHAIKSQNHDVVTVSRSHTVDDDTLSTRNVSYDQVIHPGDADLVIHITPNETDAQVKDRLGILGHSLEDIGIAVSTGRVVDFRAKEALRSAAETGTVPLIYPTNLDRGGIRWPLPHTRKPQAIVVSPATRTLLVPTGYYVLVRRFSAKEEPRRVVAAVFDPQSLPTDFVAFENHLNYYHVGNQGLMPNLARGLALYLNSTLVDIYFRQFSGHTQVNAADLRMMVYPGREMLERLGSRAGDRLLTQREIDTLLEEEIQNMTDSQAPDPVAAKRKLDEAMEILKALGLPRGQLNDRSALTLLALVGLRSDTPWNQAANPYMGITPIMDFCRDHFGTRYAPNTRETFRRQTMHQFVEACLAVANPDQPDRSINSPKWCYQIEPRALKLLRTYGTAHWEPALAEWRASVESLRWRYARERTLNKVPLRLTEERELYLSPGGHSLLIRAIIEEFAPRFAPAAKAIYVGDTGEKWAYFDAEALRELGITIGEHGKMPDVAIYYGAKNWLLLIEAVTSHGPVDAKRRNELEQLFHDSRAGLVFVTAFRNRKDMTRYISEISWATEVWVAESPTHLIHFNGERFLGPYTE
jgi:adenine-specific DNA-methyltransferase